MARRPRADDTRVWPVTFHVSEEDFRILERLRDTGFYGETVNETAEELVRTKIRELGDRLERERFAQLARDKKQRRDQG